MDGESIFLSRWWTKVHWCGFSSQQTFLRNLDFSSAVLSHLFLGQSTPWQLWDSGFHCLTWLTFKQSVAIFTFNQPPCGPHANQVLCSRLCWAREPQLQLDACAAVSAFSDLIQKSEGVRKVYIEVLHAFLTRPCQRRWRSDEAEVKTPYTAANFSTLWLGFLLLLQC